MRRVVRRAATTTTTTAAAASAAATTPSAATALSPFHRRASSSLSSAQAGSLNERALRDAADAAAEIAAVGRALRELSAPRSGGGRRRRLVGVSAAAEKVDTSVEGASAPIVLLGGDEAAGSGSVAAAAAAADAEDDMAYALWRAAELRALHERRGRAVGKRARALLEMEMLCLVEGEGDVAAAAARMRAAEEQQVSVQFLDLGGDEHEDASVEEAAQWAREHELQKGSGCKVRPSPAAAAAKLQRSFRMRNRAGRAEDSELYMREERAGTMDKLQADAALADKTSRGQKAEFSSTLDIDSVLEKVWRRLKTEMGRGGGVVVLFLSLFPLRLPSLVCSTRFTFLPSFLPSTPRQAEHRKKRSADEEASRLRFMADVVVPNLEVELRVKFPQASADLIHSLAQELAEKRLEKTRGRIGGM